MKFEKFNSVKIKHVPFYGLGELYTFLGGDSLEGCYR